MPYLQLIDGPDDIIGHTVTDRAGARQILAYDLGMTADPEWSAGILADFDAGKSVIERPNGKDHTFRVEYKEERR